MSLIGLQFNMGSSGRLMCTRVPIKDEFLDYMCFSKRSLLHGNFSLPPTSNSLIFYLYIPTYMHTHIHTNMSELCKV
jgi:hypothetical protein